MRKQLLTLLTVTMLTLVTNAQDYGLQFNAENEQRLRYLTTTGDVLDTTLNGATDYTIEAWVKPTSATFNGTVILKRWDQFALTLYEDANKRFYFTHYSSGGNTYVNTIDDAFTLNEWNHLVVVCNSSTNSIKLYSNGVDVTLGTQTALTLEASPTTPNFYLGASGSGGSYFTGEIDKVRVKNTAETISSLQSSISDTDYVSDANTAILYNFNEGSGLTTVNAADAQSATLQCSAGECDNDDDWWVNLGTLSKDEITATNFDIYPNPVEQSYFSVQAKNNESIQNIEIFDTLGKSVNSVAFDENTSVANINVMQLQAGIYIVRTKTTASIGVKKLIVK